MFIPLKMVLIGIDPQPHKTNVLSWFLDAMNCSENSSYSPLNHDYWGYMVLYLLYIISLIIYTVYGISSCTHQKTLSGYKWDIQHISATSRVYTHFDSFINPFIMGYPSYTQFQNNIDPVSTHIYGISGYTDHIPCFSLNHDDWVYMVIYIYIISCYFIV